MFLRKNLANHNFRPHFRTINRLNLLPLLVLISELIEPCMARQPVEVIETYRGHAYKFMPYSRPWHLAKKDAERQGGYLAVINDASEQDFIAQLIRKGANGNIPATWIGLTDENEEGNWKWVNGDKVEFYSWFDGEPNNHHGAENAVFIGVTEQGRVGWNDCFSDCRFHYLIEFDQEQSMTERQAGSMPSSRGKRYELVSDPKTWKEAKQHARTKGGNLVVIESAEEQALVESITKNSEGKQMAIWIGLSDEDDEGQWEWVSGEDIGYTNWGPGNPDDGFGLQDYAWIGWYGDGRWDDLQGDAKLAFLIEYASPNSKNTRSGFLKRSK